MKCRQQQLEVAAMLTQHARMGTYTAKALEAEGFVAVAPHEIE